jgi:hypothetical protein
MCIVRVAHLILLGFIILKHQVNSTDYEAPLLVASSLLGTSILLNIWFANAFNLRFSRRMGDQVHLRMRNY